MTTLTSTGGWGESAWGLSAWGGGDPFEVVSVQAHRENVIRVEFTSKVFFSTLLDAFDASDPTKYDVTVVASTGMNGLPARPVAVCHVALVQADEIDPGDVGRFVDLVLDRPFTPYPAVYTLTLHNVYSDDQSEVIDGEEFSLFGTHNVLVPPTIASPAVAFDLASPQTLIALQQATNDTSDVLKLGGYTTDDTGDYAVDSGIVSLKKRILRRLISRPGGFAHLGEDYGLGILDYVKKLGSAVVQQQLAAKAEEQISKEPEVVKCRVSFAPMPNRPGGFFMRIFVKTRTGSAHRYDVPLATVRQAA